MDGNPGILDKGTGGDRDSYVLNAKADGQLYLKRNNKVISSGAGALTPSYKYFALTYDGTVARWYVNGVLSTTSAIVLPVEQRQPEAAARQGPGPATTPSTRSRSTRAPSAEPALPRITPQGA